jgi:peptidoglycan/LPS O-acetylase OafA/YrhL
MFGMTHLWFLQYLYIYCVVLCAAWYIRSRMGFGDRTRAWSARMASRCDRFLGSRWKPLLPAVPCGLILYWDPRIVVGFYQGFLPVASKLLYYAVFFSTGVLLYRARHALQLQVRNSKVLLALAALVFAFLLPLIHQQLTGGLTGVERSILAGLLSLYASLATFGLFGAFVLTRRGYNSVTRYLAEASYWIYLIHLPFVVLAQIAVARLAVPTPFKFALSVLAAMTLALLTYQSFVRYTWVGAALNGCRRQRSGTSPAREVSVPDVVSLPAPAVLTAAGRCRDAA